MCKWITMEEEIEESEKIRNKMNDEYKKMFNTTYIGYPKFTQKPAFYY